MSVEKKYRKLDDITHILARSGMYVGSTKLNTIEKYILDENKFTESEITYNPAFIKIFDEIIINSIDESKKNPKLNQIKVTVKDNKISVWDNGGIPVVKHTEYKEWIPEMIFSNLKAGSSFNDEEQRTTAGLNGVGSVLTNVFSEEFIVSTCDGTNHFYQRFYNNMRSREQPVIKKSKKNHTEITYKPELSRFNMTTFDEMHLAMLKKRVVDIAGANQNVKIWFNEELVNIKSFEDYIKMYVNEPIYESDKRWQIGIAPSDSGFKQVSFVNSCETYDGGTHVDYILNQIISKLREFFSKKHKVDVKPSELKNHIFLFVNTTVINPTFNSQTKEKLITELKDFGSTYEVSDKFIKKILSSEVVNLILDWIQQKKAADESKLARELNKSLSKIKVDKLVDAKGKERWKCSLCMFEGDSAANATRKFRNAELIGSFALRGKFINVSELTHAKLVQNEEAINLMAAIGLKLGERAEKLKLRYGRIIIYTDQDMDGYAITGLLLNFFNKYWPELFEFGVIYKAETPIVVCTNLKNKKNIIKFYKQEDYDEWLTKADVKNWDISYKKGLSALTPDEYDEIINNPILTKITKDDLSNGKLEVWFGKESDLRKNELIE